MPIPPKRTPRILSQQLLSGRGCRSARRRAREGCLPSGSGAAPYLIESAGFDRPHGWVGFDKPPTDVKFFADASHALGAPWTRARQRKELTTYAADLPSQRERLGSGIGLRGPFSGRGGRFCPVDPGPLRLCHPRRHRSPAAGSVQSRPPRGAGRHRLPLLPHQRREVGLGRNSADADLHELPQPDLDQRRGARAGARQLPGRQAPDLEPRQRSPRLRLLQPQHPRRQRGRLHDLPRPDRQDAADVPGGSRSP